MKLETIELAGRIIKVIYLAGLPGMDAVAVKLNCGLTHDELAVAKRWARAFQLARKGGNLFELAEELHRETRGW